MASYRVPGKGVPTAPPLDSLRIEAAAGLRGLSSPRVATYQILAWQGIPSVVKAFDADGRAVSQQLPDWFQQEIDRQAMEQGLTGSDEYLARWEWSDRAERPGSPEAVLTEVVAELEQRHGARS
jgi:hypothetical protein